MYLVRFNQYSALIR